jgi:hypothetical protein
VDTVEISALQTPRQIKKSGLAISPLQKETYREAFPAPGPFEGGGGGGVVGGFGEFGLGFDGGGGVFGLVEFGFVVFGVVPFGFGAFGLGLLGLAPFGFSPFGVVDPGVAEPGVAESGVDDPGVVGSAPGLPFGFVAFGFVPFGFVVLGVVVLGVVEPGGACWFWGVELGDCAPGWPLCPEDPDPPPAGADPPGAVCATIHVPLNNKTESQVTFLTDIMNTSRSIKIAWLHNFAQCRS